MPSFFGLRPRGHEENSRATKRPLRASRANRMARCTWYTSSRWRLRIVSESVLTDDRGRAHISRHGLAAQLPAAQCRVPIVGLATPRARSRRSYPRSVLTSSHTGTHGRTMMARLFQGSIAEKVIAHAPSRRSRRRSTGRCLAGCLNRGRGKSSAAFPVGNAAEDLPRPRFRQPARQRPVLRRPRPAAARAPGKVHERSLFPRYSPGTDAPSSCAHAYPSRSSRHRSGVRAT